MSKKLSKRIVEASLLAAAIGVGGAAYAVPPTFGGAGYPAVSYAVELNYNGAANGGSGVAPGGALTPPTVPTTIGFGASAGGHLWARFEATGAVFDTAVAGTALVDSTVAGNFSNVSVAQGGTGAATAATGCVSFDITAGGAGFPATDAITFTSTALDIASNSTAVTLKYTLHSTAASGVCSGPQKDTSIVFGPVTGPWVAFANSLQFVLGNLGTTDLTETADVQATPPFALWAPSSPDVFNTGGGAALNTAEFSNLTFGLVPAPVPLIASGAASITTGQLFTKATLTVTPGGGATFAASHVTGTKMDGVLLNGAAFTTISATAASNDVTGTITNAPFEFYVNGTTPINTGTLAGSIAMTPVAGVTLETLPTVTVGTIAHNGTQIETPWFTIFPGYTSRFVITNSGATDAPYTTTVVTESGVTATAGAAATGTVKAGSTLVIDASTVSSAFSTGTRGSVIFNIAAPPQNIQGEYQTFNQSNGSVDTFRLQ